MPIRYIHNDPASVPYLESRPGAKSPRAGQLAKYTLPAMAAEQVYAAGTAEFVDWQCRDAAIRTLETWERVAGPFRFWHNQQRFIALQPRRGTGLSASYERSSIGFDSRDVGDASFFVGASTDAVSHEIGHAILDSIRPELWESLYGEVAAFHEGFADCVSLLVALFDTRVADELLAGAAQPGQALGMENASAQVAESVAAAVKTAFGAQHAASLPRRLRNTLQWAIPTTLPPSPTATNLSREPHSFGRVFAGCFYDIIDNVFRTQGPQTRQGLQSAARVAGEMLAEATRTAPEEIRFFRSIGRAMIHADTAANGGKHHLCVRDAFAAHNVSLGSSTQLAPSMALAGPGPQIRGSAARSLNARTRKDLTSRIGASGDVRVKTRVLRVSGRRVVRATLTDRVRLHVPGVKSTVLGSVNEEVLLGTQQQQCVLLGELPNRKATEQELGAFVESLANGGLLDPATTSRERTHTIRKRGRQRVLRRLRFSCRTG